MRGTVGKKKVSRVAGEQDGRQVFLVCNEAKAVLRAGSKVRQPHLGVIFCPHGA